MKTLKKLFLTLMASVACLLAVNAAILQREVIEKNNSGHKFGAMKGSRQFYLETVIKSEKIIPCINLPVVTVYADRSIRKITAAVKKGSIIVPVVDLPEVVIKANRIGTNYYLRKVSYKGKMIPVYDLPEVLITAESLTAEMMSDFKTESEIFSYVVPETKAHQYFGDIKIKSSPNETNSRMPGGNIEIPEKEKGIVMKNLSLVLFRNTLLKYLKF